MTNTLRTVWLSAGVRSAASPETSAASIPYILDTTKSESAMMG
jgi:hypothetical protein